MEQVLRANKTEMIVQDLQSCIEENFPRAKNQDYGKSDDLFEKGIVDSLGFLTIIGFIEQTFDITVSDEDVLPENFSSINAMAEYVKRSLDNQE